MSLKQLDFSKHNLVVDLAEVKRVFEVHGQDHVKIIV
jgi:hypothetical protein